MGTLEWPLLVTFVIPVSAIFPGTFFLDEALSIGQIAGMTLIEGAGHEPSLNELADAAGLSPHHFHRLFRKVAGITPKQYAMELRLRRMRKNMKENRTITVSVYESGYESNSRFSATATKDLGMKPSTFRKGGEGMSIRYGIVQSSVGWLLVAATELGICMIDMDDSPEVLDNRLRTAFPGAVFQENDPDFTSIITGMLSFIDEPGQGLPLSLDIQGTAFQRRVWAALQSIPAGSTISYSELAQRIGKPKAVRAVARACAANHLAVAVPCHRVVRSDGELGGYRWGLDRKKTLLQRESTEPEYMEHAIRRNVRQTPPRWIPFGLQPDRPLHRQDPLPIYGGKNMGAAPRRRSPLSVKLRS